MIPFLVVLVIALCGVFYLLEIPQMVFWVLWFGIPVLLVLLVVWGIRRFLKGGAGLKAGCEGKKRFFERGGVPS